MSEQHDNTLDLSSLPAARIKTRRGIPVSIVWLIPILAAAIGIWLAIQNYLNQGPVITITFNSAEGLVAGQTKIKLRDVDIGTITAIRLADDPAQGVEVIAALDKYAERFLSEDSAFWIVKPRLSGRGISGVSTLLSGPHIAMSVGESKNQRKHFVGMEVPPVLTANRAGKMFHLTMDDLGSLDYGTPVYYRRISVGEVVAYRLESDGKNVTADIFIYAPYDAFVTENTRFWTVSGLEMSMDSDGLHFSSESVTSILLGGITFSEPPDSNDPHPAGENMAFTLYPNRGTAFKHHDPYSVIYNITFHEAVHGLTVGAPVEFMGITIGEVTRIGLHLDDGKRAVSIPVQVHIYPNRLSEKMDGKNINLDDTEQKKVFAVLVNHGLRAQLRTASLITGRLYIALDFFPNAEKITFNTGISPPEIPSLSSGLQSLQNSITSIVTKLDRLPLEDIGNNLNAAIKGVHQSLSAIEQLVKKLDNGMDTVAPQLQTTLVNFQRSLDALNHLLSTDSPIQNDFRNTLLEINRAALSLRQLLDYLERHPDALLKGKAPEQIENH